MGSSVKKIVPDTCSQVHTTFKKYIYIERVQLIEPRGKADIIQLIWANVLDGC